MQQILLFKLPISVCRSTEDFLRQLDRAFTERRCLTVSFVNPYAWQARVRHPGYADDLEKIDMVFADGIGVVKALHWLTGEKIARLSFDATSLYRPFMKELCQHRRSLFIIGGVPGVATKAAERIQRDFPALTVKGSLSGFEDRDDAIAQILESDADVVLCGMGIPHQERFICQLKESGFQGIAITCGGFLDQLIRTETYYPKLVDGLELRWLYRLLKEPGRLGKRYLIDYWTFIGAVLVCLPGRLLKGRSIMPEAVSYRAGTADNKPAE